jgi:hypothetical protein
MIRTRAMRLSALGAQVRHLFGSYKVQDRREGGKSWISSNALERKFGIRG